MRSNSVARSERLRKIEELLLAAPDGLTQAEIARKLGVNRSTIFRDLTGLPASVYQEDTRLLIDRQSYLMSVRMTLHEAMALHLAVRLLATRVERQNPHAASATRKMAAALERLAPRISEHLEASASEIDGDSHCPDPLFIGVLEKVTLAWAERRKLQIWYRKDGSQVSEYTLSPYFIEPYAIGQSTHVIGWSDSSAALRTFKVERIERAELTRQPYEVVAGFDAGTLLSEAWGIWYSDREPVEVVLKFNCQAARRVAETRWHRSEKTTLLEDGSMLWRGRIAEPQEMMPWIRSWGAQVEVLEPQGLRAALGEDMRKAAELYG